MANKKIAILIHLYYVDLWKEFLSYIKNIEYEHDIYINLVKGTYSDEILNNIKEKLEKNSNNIKVCINDNVGLDIGGTMCLFDEMFKSGIEYDYILKLHTKKSIHSGRVSEESNKKGEMWRFHLINPILGSKQTVNNIINIFNNNKTVGMIGSKLCLLDKRNKFSLLNVDIINDYMEKLNMNVNINDIEFIGGTMFWVDFKIIKHYFSILNPIDIFNELEKGVFTDSSKPTKSHAFERLFGLMVLDQNKKVIGV